MPMNIVKAAQIAPYQSCFLETIFVMRNGLISLKELSLLETKGMKALPTKKLRETKRSFQPGEKRIFLTNTISIMSNTGMA